MREVRYNMLVACYTATRVERMKERAEMDVVCFAVIVDDEEGICSSCEVGWRLGIGG